MTCSTRAPRFFEWWAAFWRSPKAGRRTNDGPVLDLTPAEYEWLALVPAPLEKTINT
jgi:hypothetical protein